MRQLLPDPADDVVPYHALRPDDPHAPLVRLNMVTSVDGCATDREGRSGGLGGPGDLAVFRSLRALADGIVVGAQTVRSEGYGPHRVDRSVAGERRRDGRPDPAALVVVTRSLDLDPQARIFAEARTPTIVLTCASAPPDRRARLARVAVVEEAGDERVDVAAGIALLRRRHGLAHLLVEGGPTINADLLGQGLVDELCVTIAGQLIGGEGPRIAGRLDRDVALEPRTLLTDGKDLFARYRVVR